MLRRALLLGSVLALGCESPQAPDASAADVATDLTRDTAPADTATELPDVTPTDVTNADMMPTDAPPADSADASDADVQVTDATADASDVADVSDASDVSDVVLDDSGAPPCTRDSECVGFGERGVCDTARGRCVECLATRDLCPSDQHCDDATHTCVDGCRTDDGCVGTTRLHCDVLSHACVACTRDDHCPSGQLCIANACRVGCSLTRPCAGASTCCAGGCVDTQSSLLHCGMCDAPCAPPNAVAECRAGRCAIARCLDGFADCDGTLTNGCETDLRIDSAHCGSCATACRTPPHTVSICSDMACSVRCEDGFDDCDANPTNGCETELATSSAHCGACGRACALPNATASCAAGRCAVGACNGRYADCDRDPTNGCEVNTGLDVNNCGACGTICPAPMRADPVCAAGVCGMSSCSMGFGNCDGLASNGCETVLTGDVANCGACGLRCATPPNASPVCPSGRCVLGPCTTGFDNCDGLASNGCEAAITTSTTHCGRCGNACPTGQSCTAGVCGCPAGRTYCASACVDTASDVANCGACGRRCASTQVCSAGTCTYPQLRFVLSWSGVGDLNLRVRTPLNNDIWSGNPTADGGRLDADVRTAPGPETVYWSGTPTRGYYNVCVSGTTSLFRTTFTVSIYRGTTLATTLSGVRTGTTPQQTCLLGTTSYVSRFLY